MQRCERALQILEGLSAFESYSIGNLWTQKRFSRIIGG
jgi:hypothetical protein